MFGDFVRLLIDDIRLFTDQANSWAEKKNSGNSAYYYAQAQRAIENVKMIRKRMFKSMINGEYSRWIFPEFANIIDTDIELIRLWAEPNGFQVDMSNSGLIIKTKE